MKAARQIKLVPSGDSAPYRLFCTSKWSRFTDELFLSARNPILRKATPHRHDFAWPPLAQGLCAQSVRVWERLFIWMSENHPKGMIPMPPGRHTHRASALFLARLGSISSHCRVFPDIQGEEKMCTSRCHCTISVQCVENILSALRV